jgi:hypothetical protein
MVLDIDPSAMFFDNFFTIGRPRPVPRAFEVT